MIEQSIKTDNAQSILEPILTNKNQVQGFSTFYDIKRHTEALERVINLLV